MKKRNEFKKSLENFNDVCLRQLGLFESYLENLTNQEGFLVPFSDKINFDELEEEKKIELDYETDPDEEFQNGDQNFGF